MNQREADNLNVVQEPFAETGEAFGIETITTVPAEFFDEFFLEEMPAPTRALIEAVRAYRATVVRV